MRSVDVLLPRAIAIAILQLYQLLTSQTIFPTADAAVQAGGTVPSNEAPNGIVAVNQGLIVTGFVRFEGISVPGLCIELREFRIEDSEAIDDMTVLLSRWEDRTMANSLQLHRTGIDGSFAFVAPESSIPKALYMGFYSQGGDYPTVVRSFSGRPNQGRKGQTANKTFSVWRASGRVELNIDLADELEAAEVLWDSAARENDHSPCAWREGSTTVVEGLKERPDLWEPRPLHNRRQGVTGLQAPGMVIPLQSACWNYGQSDAGLWQEDVALCDLLRKPHSGETLHWAIINWSLETGWKTIASLKDAGRGWIVQATIGIVGLGLCLLVFPRKAGIGNSRRGKSSVLAQRGQSSRLQDRPGHGLRAQQVTISSPMRDTKWGDTNEHINQEDKDMFPLVFRALSHHDDEIQDSLGGYICGGNFILTRGQC